MYLDQPLAAYLDALASNAPAPGGGSAAALVGALAAALNSMVANFTVGKEQFANVEATVRDALAHNEELRATLSQLVEEDTAAYGKVSSAYRMPRATDAEKAARTAAIQEALKSACSVPLAAADCCLRVIEIADTLADSGNPNLISDAGVAARLGAAGLATAALNVEINLVSIKDAAFVKARRAHLAPMLARGQELGEAVWKKVLERIGA